MSQPSRVLTVEAVQHALDAAVARAGELGVAINVAVVDAGGLLLGFLRMPGTHLHSREIAVDKAYTAASFGRATGDWPELFKQRSESLERGLVGRERFIGFGGGLPLVLGNVRVGGVGVSGASEEQGIQCAGASVRRIGAD